MKKHSTIIIISFLVIAFIFLAEAMNRFEQSYKLKKIDDVQVNNTRTMTKVSESETLENSRAEKIAISGIEVKNFFITTEKLNENNDRLLEKNKEYSIVYHPLFNQFLIAITDSPFPKIRKNAEQKFLEILEINNENACKLDVVVSTASFINPDHAGSYKLSFCE